MILHGWNSNSDRWTAVAELLSDKGYKVIVPDLPGFGQSEPLQVPWNTNKYITWIEQFAKELNLGNYYLMGHSFGGALALKVAIKHAQEVDKLFLVSAAIIRKKTAKKGISAKIAKVVGLFSFLPYYPLFRKAVYKFIIRKSDYVYANGVMKQTYLNVVSEDVGFQLPFTKVPTIIIWGDKDADTPFEEGKIINDKIKNSKLVVIPGAGHRLNKEQPEILSEKILENI